MPIIGVYARASKDRTELRVSVERQTSRCRELAESLFPGQPIVVYVDNSVSGSDPNAVRPGYLELIAAIRRGEIGELVCHEQSRLTRQPQQWEELVVTLTRAGISRVHTVQGGVVPVDSGNRLLGRIMAVVDAEEAERVKARTRAAAEQLRTEGRPGGGPDPYGYRRATGVDGRPSLEVDDDQAAVIRWICDQICDGYSLSSIADELNHGARPTPTVTGGLWTAAGIRAMAMRPSLAGLRSKMVRGKGVKTRQEIVGSARWEPIVTEQRWRQVLDMLEASTVTGADGKTYTVRRQQPGRPRRWQLTGGLARCGRCDGPLVVAAVNGYLVYRCGDRHGGCGHLNVGPADKVDEYVHGQLVDYLASNPKVLSQLAVDDPDRGRLDEERRHAERDMTEAVILKRDGEIDEVEFRLMHSGAKKRRDQVQGEIDAMPIPDTAVPDFDTIRNHWEQLPLSRKHKALVHYIDAVVVNPGRGNYRDPMVRIGARVEIRWRQRSKQAD